MTGNAASDYRAKTSRELSSVSREMKRSGHPEPLGDPLSGTMILVGQPVGPRVLDAISRSLGAIELDAYVTYTATNLTGRQLLLAEPRILAAIGPEAAAELDDLNNPLVSKPFSEAAEAVPFAWKKSATGLLLPPLAPALDDEDQKQRFWRAFLVLRTLQ